MCVQLGVLVFTSLFLLPGRLSACTTAVISGKLTADGRPILWKLRDTEVIRNKFKHYTDGKYPYVAIVNADSTAKTMVWGGCNSAGFGIMNSASFNLNKGDTSRVTDQEGKVMKLALMRCATLEDFEKMLEGLPKPWGLNANFGVIDAQGGAAYYETDNGKFVKFDANDPRVAPEGYLIRTNYSYTGTPNVGYGFIRFATAQEIINRRAAMGRLDLSLFVDELARSLYNSMTGDDFSQRNSAVTSGEMINSSDLLCRNGTASNIVIHGVREGESPDRTVLWGTVAYPLSTVALPAWPFASSLLPSCASGGADSDLPALSAWGLAGLKRCYPITRGSGSRYMDIAAYKNSVDGGFGPVVSKAEREVMARTRAMVSKWGDGAPQEKEVRALYAWVDEFLRKEYETLFPEGT